MKEKPFEPMFPGSQITEEQENLLMDLYMSGACRCHTKRGSLPGSEPEIRRSARLRKPKNQLEKIFLERGLSS